MKVATTQIKKYQSLAKEYADTLFAMLAIVTGVAAALMLFEVVDANKESRNLIGAVILAYALVSFASVVHRGVRQNGEK